MARSDVVGLVYYAYDEHSYDEKRLVFASRNEKAIYKLQEQLSLFCNKNESLKVERFDFGLPTINENDEILFLTESFSDYNYCLHIDEFDIQFKTKLKEDQYLNKMKLVSTPSISDINEFCRYSWGFNDFHKRLSLIKRIEKAKKTGDYWQNPEQYTVLEALL